VLTSVDRGQVTRLALQTALAVTPFQHRFTRAVRPLIVLFNGTANAIVRWLGAEPQEELRVARTPAELASLIDTSAEEGTVPAEVARLLRRTLAFGDKTAGDVMTPRVRVVALQEAHRATDLLEAARRSGHSDSRSTADRSTRWPVRSTSRAPSRYLGRSAHPYRSQS
jgi:CBS domain containing-hemolysin-like protein